MEINITDADGRHFTIGFHGEEAAARLAKELSHAINVENIYLSIDGRRCGLVKKKLDQETFVELWQTSDSPEEAAERMGIPKLRAQQRAADYRKLGVRLKKFKRKRIPVVGVERLNKLIEELGRKKSKQ